MKKLKFVEITDKDLIQNIEKFKENDYKYDVDNGEVYVTDMFDFEKQATGIKVADIKIEINKFMNELKNKQDISSYKDIKINDKFEVKYTLTKDELSNKLLLFGLLMIDSVRETTDSNYIVDFIVTD